MSTNTPRICPFRPITILENQESSVFPAAFYFDSNIALAFTFFFFAGKILKNFCPFTVWSRNSQPGPFSLSIKIFYGKSDPSPALFRSGAPFLPEIPAIFPGTWLRKSRFLFNLPDLWTSFPDLVAILPNFPGPLYVNVPFRPAIPHSKEFVSQNPSFSPFRPDLQRIRFMV